MILEKIKTEQKQARLNRDKFRAQVLTTLMAEVQIVGKNAQRETTDAEAIKVVTKFLKGANETKTFCRPLSEQLFAIQDEIEIYNEFMPKQMTEAELTKAVQDFIGNNPNTIMGQVMQHLKAEYDGKYDGKMASKIVRELV